MSVRDHALFRGDNRFLNRDRLLGNPNATQRSTVRAFKSALLKIERFLKRLDKVRRTLDALEGRVNSGVERGDRPTRALSVELARREKSRGFARPATLTANIEPDDFLQTLADARPLKDPGAGELHGEHAHRIQWWCIIEAGVLPGRQVVRAYRNIGLLEVGQNPSRTQTLWQFLVDRSGSSTDGRSPETVTRLLVTEDGLISTRYPFLARAVLSRREKRARPNGAVTRGRQQAKGRFVENPAIGAKPQSNVFVPR